MRILSKRSIVAALAGLLLAAGLAACGPSEDERLVDAEYPMGPLSFAGVDAVYALRRIAAEAGLVLVVDEFRPRKLERHDLASLRFDMDLPAGPVAPALAALKEQTGDRFTYRVRDGVLLVRSTRVEGEQDILDEPRLPAAALEVDFRELLAWILAHEPMSLIGEGDVMGQPVLKKVKLDIPDRSSIIEVLTMYAKAVPVSVHILRAGYEFEEGNPDRLVSNAVGLWGPLIYKETLPPYRRRGSIVYTLAEVADRAGALVCVLDRSVLNDARGALDYGGAIDRGWPLHEAIARLARYGSKDEIVRPIYSWKLDDGLYKIRSERFDYYLTGHEFLGQPVNGGEFEGTLGQLGRWLNHNQKNSPGKVFVSGEMDPSWPVAKLQIADGTKVVDVLYQFARASQQGWYVVIHDALTPDQPPPGNWAGAYLTRLVDWGPKGWEGLEPLE